MDEDLKTSKSIILPSLSDINEIRVREVFEKLLAAIDSGHKKIYEDLTNLAGAAAFRASDLMSSAAATTPVDWTDVTSTYSGRYMRVGATGLATGGSSTSGSHTLITSEIPAHNHTFTFATVAASGSTRTQGNPYSASGSFSTSNTGGDGGHTHNGITPIFVDMKLFQKD